MKIVVPEDGQDLTMQYTIRMPPVFPEAEGKNTLTDGNVRKEKSPGFGTLSIISYNSNK